MTTLLTYAFDNEQELLKVVRFLNERDVSYSVVLKDLSIRITEAEASMCGLISFLPDKYKLMSVFSYGILPKKKK